MRGAKYKGGYHDFTIRTGGLEVFPRLVAAEHRGHFAPSLIASGVAQIDRLLGGGLDRGTSTVLIGPAGCGKSTIAFQYAIAAANRGEHSEVFAFDESTATLKKRMEGLGATFTIGPGPGEIAITPIDPAEISPGEFGMYVRRAVDDRKTTVLIIDSLNGYLNAMPEERFLVLQLHELLSSLGSQGVTTLLIVAQHGILGGPVQSPFDTSYLADSVILFRFFENAGRVAKAISVVKKRSGLHEDTIRAIRFDEQGIHVSDPLHDFQGVLTGVPTVGSGSKKKAPR
jgi:circadian clock protein KaiC